MQNTFHRTSFYLHIILFGVLAVVLTLCHLNHIRLLTNYEKAEPCSEVGKCETEMREIVSMES